jgi:hypothetical protein
VVALAGGARLRVDGELFFVQLVDETALVELLRQSKRLTEVCRLGVLCFRILGHSISL